MLTGYGRLLRGIEKKMKLKCKQKITLLKYSNMKHAGVRITFTFHSMQWARCQCKSYCSHVHSIWYDWLTIEKAWNLLRSMTLLNCSFQSKRSSAPSAVTMPTHNIDRVSVRLKIQTVRLTMNSQIPLYYIYLIYICALWIRTPLCMLEFSNDNN